MVRGLWKIWMTDVVRVSLDAKLNKINKGVTIKWAQKWT